MARAGTAASFLVVCYLVLLLAGDSALRSFLLPARQVLSVTTRGTAASLRCQGDLAEGRCRIGAVAGFSRGTGVWCAAKKVRRFRKADTLASSRQSYLQRFIVEIPELGGAKIAITPCPGKRERDLGEDLDQLRSWGAQAIVTLVQDHELSMLSVPNMKSEVEKRGMEWFHCPIPDFDGPGGPFEVAWRQGGAGQQVRHRLQAGGKVVVHCRGGIGRAGTIAATLLVELGVTSPDDALRRVRKARPGAVETWEQERYVLAVKPVAT